VVKIHAKSEAKYNACDCASLRGQCLRTKAFGLLEVDKFRHLKYVGHHQAMKLMVLLVAWCCLMALSTQIGFITLWQVKLILRSSVSV